MQEKEFYKPSELARFLGVSKMTIYRYIKKGEIKVARLGKTILIPKQEFEKWKALEVKNG